MTIHCVTPNPALDVTYRLDRLTLHQVNRVADIVQRPGGKGVNVARILAAHGHDVEAHGFLGGATGALLGDLLNRLQPAIGQHWTAVETDTRRTVAVVDPDDTTMLNEVGAPVTAGDWAALIRTLGERCRPGDVVTVSGSLPQGSAPERVADLVAAARSGGATIIVDTSGPGLVAAARAGAHVLKPNQHEIVEATDRADVSAGIDVLLTAGAGAVVTSLGADGILLGTPDRRSSAGLDRVLRGNPTGAGDALVAALAHHLHHSADGINDTLNVALPTAIAWSAAAVLSPVAGEIDTDAAVDLAAHHVTLKELSCSHH